MKRKWVVRHPEGWGLISSAGFGGPSDPPLVPPGHSLPNLPPENQAPPNPLQGVGDAIKAGTGNLLAAGEVLVGVLLLVVGLLLATGVLQRGARTAARVAPVGRIARRAIRR